MEGPLPLILVEGVLVFGGVLAFAWWQFRDLKREREKTAAAARPVAEAADGADRAAADSKVIRPEERT